MLVRKGSVIIHLILNLNPSLTHLEQQGDLSKFPYIQIFFCYRCQVGDNYSRSRAVAAFKRKDRLYSPIEKGLVSSMRNAKDTYNKRLEAAKKVRDEQPRNVTITKLTKEKQKAETVENALTAERRHAAIL